MKLLSVLVIFAIAFAACRNATVENANGKKTVSPQTKIVAAEINSPDQASKNAGVKTGRGIGVITKINLEIGSVELKHDEIKGMMPAMQMEFYVRDKKELEPLKVGDKATFILEDNRGAEKIIEISKIE